MSDILGAIKKVNHKDVPNWVIQLKELLHHDQTNLRLKYLSDQLNIHPVYISRAVPKCFRAVG